MPFTHVILILIIIGVTVILIKAFLPIDNNIKKILYVLFFVITIMWLVQLYADFGPLNGVRLHEKYSQH